MPEDAQPAPPPLEDLQFRRAEFASEPPPLACAGCGTSLADEYFQLGGVPICGACAAGWQALQGKPPAPTLLRGALFGFGAALAGAVGMAVIAGVSGLQFGIAAIGVGWLVGKAMRLGTSGLGSRRCQAIAVALTYLGITLSYLPAIVKGLHAHAVSPVVLVVVSLAAPVLELADGLNGILGLAILLFGLAQAWRMTGRDPRVLSGPYSTKPVEG